MRRRDLIILVGFGVARPLAARAQEPGRTHLSGSSNLFPAMHLRSLHCFTNCGATASSKVKTSSSTIAILDRTLI